MVASHQPRTPERGSGRLSARLCGPVEQPPPDILATGVRGIAPIAATGPIVHGHLRYIKYNETYFFNLRSGI